MKYKKNAYESSNVGYFIIVFAMIVVLLIGVVAFICSLQDCSANTIERYNSNPQWGGYYPGEIYQVYDRDTGVYYAITEQGGITPMYTIDGEVKLVDQGNEYVVHKNLGEPTVSED